MSVNSVGITLDRRDSITLWASQSEDSACLVIDTEGTHCEIGMDRVVVEALRDQLPAVLAGLDRRAAEDAECVKAGMAEQRAVDAAARALDLAVAADAAGAHDKAASLRASAADATAKANAVDVTVGALERATAEADHAAEKLIYLTGEAAAAPRGLGDGERVGRV